MVYFSRPDLSEVEDLSGCTQTVKHAAAHTQILLQPEQISVHLSSPITKRREENGLLSGLWCEFKWETLMRYSKKAHSTKCLVLVTCS